jgi:hypothetical protein
MLFDTTFREEPGVSGNYRPPLFLILGALRSLDRLPCFIPDPLVMPLVSCLCAIDSLSPG